MMDSCWCLSCMDVLHEPSFHQRAYIGVTVNSYSLRNTMSNKRTQCIACSTP
jgi:hypothetical protein